MQDCFPTIALHVLPEAEARVEMRVALLVLLLLLAIEKEIFKSYTVLLFRIESMRVICGGDGGTIFAVAEWG